MKRNLVFLLAFLCFAFVCCKDDETSNRIYPKEPQPAYGMVDKMGRLYYDEESKEWRMGFTQEDLDKPLPDRLLGDEEGAHLVIENCSEEYQKLEGELVRYSGTLVYQYLEQSWLGNIVINTYVYSLMLKEVHLVSVASTRSTNSIHMGCPTPAPEPPLWFFTPQTRSVSLKNYLINVFVHVVRSSFGVGFDKDVVSQTIINNLNEYYENTYISFRLLGDEYIDSSNLNDISVANRELLFNRNGHSQALDIYVLSSGAGFIQDKAAGVARSIPSTACILNSSYYRSSSLSHEVGIQVNIL